MGQNQSKCSRTSPPIGSRQRFDVASGSGTCTFTGSGVSVHTMTSGPFVGERFLGLGAFCLEDEARRAGKESTACAACGTIVPKMQLCGICKGVRYCNSTCQKQHWPLHQQECKDSGGKNLVLTLPSELMRDMKRSTHEGA